jgi:hypothetical protein
MGGNDENESKSMTECAKFRKHGRALSVTIARKRVVIPSTVANAIR